ncbi:hypothetical protein [Solibacillus sp. NPDC093137]|uniref:hypothetical protein n=1 Tax=Solibacillus sp. NPDC093137 TaxID=3390678 RepID=UPI003D05D7D7
MDRDRIFLCYSGIIALIIMLIFGTFTINDVKEDAELRETSIKIRNNYLILQDKKEMGCFLNMEVEMDQKKVKLFLDEDMNIVTCGEQIVQFTHYALKSPFTLEIIEYP